MVRLLPMSSIVQSPIVAGFNPTMVRLLLENLTTREIRKGFNPTMVRLLRVMSTQEICFSIQFQSHNGAIAAYVISYI